MKLHIAFGDRTQPILICDEENNDIAEFFHSDQATVGQSYETALALAQALVGFQETAEFARDAIGKRISDGIDDDLPDAFGRLSSALSSVS